MKPFDAFSIIVRTLGLLLILSALATLFYALSDLALGGLGIGTIVWMNFGVSAFVVGLWFLVAFGPLYPSRIASTALLSGCRRQNRSPHQRRYLLRQSRRLTNVEATRG
jgi:hypothetical protein